MNWLYTATMTIAISSVLGMLLTRLGGDGGIFKCVRIVISLVLSVFIISSVLNTDFDLFSGFDIGDADTGGSMYSDGVAKSFSQSLEEGIKNDINNMYSGADAEVYVIAEINDKYELEVINVSASVSAGDINKILKTISENYSIEKEKIFVQRE